MKISKVMLGSGLAVAFLLGGCRGANESAGDKFLKGGDPINAMMQYEKALQKGKVSKEFYKNYALANIQIMALRSKEDPLANFLDDLSDSIASMLKQNPNPENEALFANNLSQIAMQRINSGSAEGEERGFKLLNTAEGLSAKPADLSSRIGGLRTEFLKSKLAEIEKDYASAASEPTDGIIADYKMNKLQLIFGKETEEMRPLWSKIRKVNINTYLMYDLEGLLPELDARINKFGVLLAIVQFKPGPTSMNVQLKAFNGTSHPIHFEGDKFTLYDRAGNAYTPAKKIGNFNSKDVIGIRDESKTGGLTFNYPSGTEPYYIEFKNKEENFSSRKYLP